MKSKMAVFWFVVSLALGAVLAVQWNGAGKKQAKLEALQVQVEKVSEQARRSQAELEELRQERSDLRSEVANTQAELRQAAQKTNFATRPADPLLPAGASAARQPGAARGAGMGGFFEGMLKDPEMRKAMEQQQRMGLNMTYGTLLKQLQLTPDQETKFKELLLSQQMSNVSQAGALLEPGADKAALAGKLREEQKERDAQMQQLLGEEKFGQFQEYNQTLGERMMLEHFGKDIGSTPEQNEQLLAIFKEEKKNTQINFGADPTNPNRELQAVIGSPEAAEQLLQQQEQVNARVLERAGAVLAPEQVRKLEPVLKSQLEMQRAGMRMARQMFGGEQAPAEGEK